ncbi:hypothetical protein CW745_06035 [Psychromonas sp. psych-6C06]|uniref:hypothetical protein n=1 Tax=Psychromonas sp. psych-6C06 TaxID=2058089 RepID=UPI000C34B104|nr:hypothetical protein [Psychromonas sp. psych-6C06]PKF62983.1 hypothetical protein CW745_06035 [Psychromonas sp. psych-6C06]
MKLQQIYLALMATGLITACANTAVDNTPQHPTSVLTAKYTLNGLYIPDHQGVQTVYTQADKRTIHEKAEFDSFYMAWANYDTSVVFRIDQNLLLNIDHEDESYLECPLAGCKNPLEEYMAKVEESPEEEEEYESYEDKSCQVSVVENNYEVNKTGQQRSISGLPTEEYTLTWTLSFEDEKGKKDTNLIQFIFWTTTPNAEIKKAWKVHQTATDNYLDAVGDNNAIVRLLGKEGYKAISSFTGDIEKTDSEALSEFVAELNKIQGYPLSIKFEWFQDNKACAEVKPKKESAKLDLNADLADTATNFLGGLLKDEAEKNADKVIAEWMKDARVRYIYDVTSVSEKMINDSKFEVPANYKLIDRQ